jgi:hypothetical protein
MGAVRWPGAVGNYWTLTSDLAPTSIQDMPNFASKSWNNTKVRCLAGSRADERPIAVLVEGKEIEIRAILKSWREPDYLYFRVETGNGRTFELRHHEHADYWEMREVVARR